MAVEMLSPSAVDELHERRLTYPEVGGTAGALPVGYAHLSRSREVAAPFEDAAGAIMTWQVQARSGLRVLASSPDVVLDGVVLLRFGWGRLGLSIPCRVVRVIDEPDRQGFAYGTLPGHPERGEEAFVVSRDGRGVVTLTVTAFCRPATLLARLGGPLTTHVQHLMIERYLRALG